MLLHSVALAWRTHTVGHVGQVLRDVPAMVVKGSGRVCDFLGDAIYLLDTQGKPPSLTALTDMQRKLWYPQHGS